MEVRKSYSTFQRGKSLHSDFNYRPISIVPIVAKVFERIIYDQVYSYVTENNLISSQQYGFRSLHSTVTAL